MATRTFVPGQRWISNTESDLGLGVVDGCDGRRVTLRFPAAKEQRTYAMDNAPLTRVLYPVGESVKLESGEQITITSRTRHEERVDYAGVDAAGVQRNFQEEELDSFARFSRPQDRLLTGQLDPIGHFALRVQTLRHRHQQGQSPVRGLLGARVALLPHQIYIASQVSARHAPRVLLADEVGLGKTIEAGLVIHQQIISGRGSRALLVVPDSLVHQWLVEMLRRFNLRFTILDDERCEALENSVENPFESAQLVICPLSALASDTRRQQQAVAAGWDLLIVDEAHHLQWSEHESSPAYEAVEALAQCVPGLLLLTATPEQLGAQGHFARLRLLDPDRYPDPARFREEEAGYHAISTLVQRLRDGDANAGAPDAAQVLSGVQSYLGPAMAKALQQGLEGGEPEAAVERVVRALLDRHGTGRVLFRNTRDAVGGFPPRRLIAQPLPVTDDDLAHDALDAMLHPTRALGDGWTRRDGRVAWLEAFLQQHRGERTLVICARSDTARSLEEHLRIRTGLRTATFHEDTSLVARDRAAAYFAEAGSDGAEVLICSEIGSEGRNFQHASRLVLFDLPLDPELLEQRIGRLDRIGQRQEVEIQVPYHEGGPDQVLLRFYHEGLDAFERPCAIGERMREKFAERLDACLASPGDRSMLDALIADVRVAAADTLSDLERGRDRLLEIGSCDPQQAAETLHAIVETSRSRELAAYMTEVFDLFGVEHQPHGPQSIAIQPGNHMICHDFPGLPEDGCSGTFARQQALAREDLEFLTWEHPMVMGAMDLILDGELGNASLCTLKAPPITPGTLVLEGIFVMHCPGPRGLGLNRYLAQDMLRWVVASTGQDLSEALSAGLMEQRARDVPEDTARELLRRAWPIVEKLISQAQGLATKGQAQIVEDAISAARAHHATELERLRALAQVNPNIRAEEITGLETRAEEIRQHLSGAQLRLDAVRVGIVN